MADNTRSTFTSVSSKSLFKSAIPLRTGTFRNFRDYSGLWLWWSYKSRIIRRIFIRQSLGPRSVLLPLQRINLLLQPLYLSSYIAAQGAWPNCIQWYSMGLHLAICCVRC